MKTRIVLCIDPGRDKCGIAIVSDIGTVHREVCESGETIGRVSFLLKGVEVEAVLIGNGTGSKEMRSAVKENFPGANIVVVDEAYSSQRARRRFFDENPPRGLRRLVPKSMLYPDAPYDDLVAVILAEDYLRRT